MLAGLPYVMWPFGSFFILGSRKREDPFLFYHAVQSLMAGFVLALSFVFALLALVLCFRLMPVGTVPDAVIEANQTVWSAALPGLFSGGILVLGVLFLFSLFLVAVFLGWRATEGEMLRIPYLGDIAEEKMLDQTGMTRRQFVKMLEDSLQPPPVQEEEIPFPEVENSAPSSPQRAIDRLEATRRARQAQTAERQPIEEAPRETQRFQELRQSRERPEPSSPPERPEGPSVRELDLIGHYKETQISKGEDSQAKRETLRNWLSAVDPEGQ